MAGEDNLTAAQNARRCFLIERAGEDTILDRFGFEAVDPEAADLIIIAGREGERVSLAHSQRLLSPLARRRVPALSLNPDRVMITPSGLSFGAGRIAETYAAMGGEVTWIGKP